MSENAVAQYSIENVESAIKDAVQHAIQVEMRSIGAGGGQSAVQASQNSVSTDNAMAEQIMTSLHRIEAVITNLRDKLQVKKKSQSTANLKPAQDDDARRF